MLWSRAKPFSIASGSSMAMNYCSDRRPQVTHSTAQKPPPRPCRTSILWHDSSRKLLSKKGTGIEAPLATRRGQRPPHDDPEPLCRTDENALTLRTPQYILGEPPNQRDRANGPHLRQRIV